MHSNDQSRKASCPPDSRCVVISGCSGGGKSTLLAALQRLGYAVVEEPGRRIVQHALENGETALPWVDMEAFLRRAIAVAQADRQAITTSGPWVFFDRSVVDAATALEHLTGEPALARFAAPLRYCPQVFITPPWLEIYRQDEARQHDFSTAQAEYQRLIASYPALGYQVALLPKMGVAARVRFILDVLTRD